MGSNLRAVRLLSESLRITLNLALTNVLYASIAGASNSSHGFGSASRYQDTLAVALERVNGSSTAVIQTHRDSAREGFSLAFAPDLITDGLVSAALTVLQLASPFAHGVGSAVRSSPAGGRMMAPGPSVDDHRPMTPNSPEDKADIEMSDVTAVTQTNSTATQSLKSVRQISTVSSPATTPGPSTSSTAQDSCAPFSSAAYPGSEGLGKKPLMEPAVAAHYIRMATDVLRTSDRSQTKLGTTMASKIITLAIRAGLLPGVTPTSRTAKVAPASSLKQAAVSTSAIPQCHQSDHSTNTQPGRASVEAESEHMHRRLSTSSSNGPMEEEQEDEGEEEDEEDDDEEEDQEEPDLKTTTSPDIRGETQFVAVPARDAHDSNAPAHDHDHDEADESHMECEEA